MVARFVVVVLLTYLLNTSGMELIGINSEDEWSLSVVFNQ